MLDRPAEQHEPGRVTAGAAHQRRQRHRLLAPVVGQQGSVLHGVLHQTQLLVPPGVDLGDDVEDQPVEALAAGGPLGDPGVAGHDARATLAASASVAGHPPALVHTASLKVRCHVGR